ncbi:NAD-dependent succinate-semialdehyde dehydrogenase [Brucella anthropi]|uniref:NAD-dependent succinate-semialdehyde dehydrogenase n=1 Tax=Brucella anthropi TaxID=529 RepID=A0A6I0DHH9_BRUAN|nr:NAD-dependent succinate-semialdehyde dehydrogenase [Brucella anthropi]KAB2790349.1 NAD-dependent succinate-semialdehyde dehydrogenase [Brucella anthropi]
MREAAFVGGKWQTSLPGEGLEIHDPATGALLGRVPYLGTEDVERAIDAAALAQRLWAECGARTRAGILKRWHALVVEHRDELATILSREQGKPLTEALSEIDYGASYIEWFAEEARRTAGNVLPAMEPNKRMVVMKQPVGVVAAITPWNFPCAMVTRKVAPALAAGCAILVKPASQTPFSAIALAVLAEEAGIPSGLFSILTGSAKRIGAALTASDQVRKLSFTGSTEIGVSLYAQSAATVKKLSLELGGNAPVLVFDDCDLEAAVDAVMQAKFRNGGQTCVCANRILVQSGIHDAFLSRLVERVSELSVGNGQAEGTDIGPLINAAAVEKVLFHIADAKARGGRLHIGGTRADAIGPNFVYPAVLSGVSREMSVFSEETFGPVAPILRFETAEEALKLANDTPFGLASYVFTRDVNRVLRICERLEFGMIGVNTGQISAAEAPFGGIKLSGLGREGGHEGIEDYLESKYVCIGILEEQA